RFGIDRRGTKTEFIALEDTGAELLPRRVLTPGDDYHAMLDTAGALVTDAERELHARGTVGIGSPGAMSRAPGLLRAWASVGLRGCIETFLSGPGMEHDHWAVTAQRASSHAIVTGAASGDAGCEATMQRYEQRLARALAHVINIVDPDVIVLGGGMSNIDRLYAKVPERWGRWVFSDRVDTRLVRHVHGDSSGVRGAAWLWPSEKNHMFG